MFSLPTFKKSSSSDFSEFTAIIPEGMTVLGNIELDCGESLIVEGQVKGSITQPPSVAEGKGAKVTLQKLAKVSGSISVDIVVVNGAHLVSSIDAQDVLISNNGRVEGNITYARLGIEQGCIVTGSLAVIEPNSWETPAKIAEWAQRAIDRHEKRSTEESLSGQPGASA